MKKLIYSLFIIILALPALRAQEKQHISIHEEQLLLYGSKQKQASKYDTSGKGIIPLQQRRGGLEKIVFGFLPDWEYENGAANNIHYDLLSHLAVFTFTAASSGNLSNPSAWPWTDVINAAHSQGTKVILTVTNFGGSEEPDYVAEKIMTDSNSKNNFFNQVKNKITTYSLDGVNIDFEGLPESLRGSTLNTFLAELTDYIHTQLLGKEVSFDGPAVNWGGWDLDGLTQSVDYVFIMAYDYYGSWSSNTGPVSPLTDPNGGISVSKTLSSDYGVPKSKYPEKLILGVPYYGNHWETANSNPGAPVTNYIEHTFYRNDVINAENHGGYLWNSGWQTSWYRWEANSTWNQVWSDNENALSKKYDLALTQNLGGVGIWALNYDGTREELWNLIHTKFAGGTTPLPAAPDAVAAIRKDAATITLKFREGNYADTYRVYQSTDNLNFSMVKEESATEINVTGLTTGTVYYFKIESVNTEGVSNKTKVVAAMPSDKASEVLIVDGVERRSFDAVVQYAYPFTQLGRTFSSASNEAVIHDVVDLNDFNVVIWMLLDESTADDTLNKDEQNKLKTFIDNQKLLIISGSELGWDLVEKGDATDQSFYENYLKAEYLRDDPGTSDTYYTAKDLENNLYHFDDGTHGIQKIAWPDLIKAKNGSSMSFTYQNVSSATGYAGVNWKNGPGGVEYLAFPIETVYTDSERKTLLKTIFDQYSALLKTDDPLVLQNFSAYPNPTNGILYFKDDLELGVDKIKVYNLSGQLVKEVKNTKSIDLQSLEVGIYFVRIITGSGKSGTFRIIKT